MNRQQTLTITVFMLIFVILFFGFDTKNNKQKALEKSRAQNLELISIERLKNEAVLNIPRGIAVKLGQLEEETSLISVDTELVDIYKEISNIWNNQGHPLISAHYAERSAQIINDEASWTKAGITFFLAAQRQEEEKERKYSAKRGRAALENAVSLNPLSPESKINLAMSYVDVPSETEPMKGILMLLDINREYPENTKVLLQLAKLALRTNQVSKAEQRLLNALEINPELIEAHCLLYEIYREANRNKEAEERRILCEIQ
ncbi:MAG: hypothetical protein HKO89_01510 [Saprospiraceae bacterium]|nr:hypothetical protein [Saprospiraceae bacterium]